MGGGGAEQESGSSFTQSVWGPQAGALNQLYGALGSLFGSTMSGMQGLIPSQVDYAQRIADQSMPYWQQQMQGGAYRDLGLQNLYQQALQTGGGNEQAINEMIMGGAGNDYADAMRDTVMRQAGDLTDQMLAKTDARAAAAGMSGGSRQGVLQAQGMEDINRQAQEALTGIGYSTFDKDLQRKLDIARRADQYDMGRLNNISSMLGQQQSAMQGGLGYGSQMQGLGMGTFNPYMAPWSVVPTYSAGIGRPTVLSDYQTWAEAESGK